MEDVDWRLLLRVARVRWLAIAMALSYAFVGFAPGRMRWTMLAAGLVAAACNLAIWLGARDRRWDSQRTARLSILGDIGWMTATATVLALSEHVAGAGLIAAIVVSESALLEGWRGAAAGVAAGTAALLAGTVVDGALHGGGVDVAGLAYVLGLLVVAAGSAGVWSTELRDRHDALRDQAASLARHARTDHLTGLANAVALDEALQRQAAAAYGLLLVDVDNLRFTNHLYGHPAGDEMLQAVARVLTAISGPADVASRYTEDKFFLLLAGACRDRTVAVAEEVRRAVHGVAVSAGQLRVSVGCAWSTAGSAPKDVIHIADDALLAAKAAGGDRVEAQAPHGAPGRWQMRNTVEAILDKERGGVYSVYQRIVRLRDGATVAWEALSRPHDWPADTDVEGLFLAAHRIGRARDLDWRCRQNALWEAARLQGPLFVNVNVGGLVDPVHGADQMQLLCRWAGRSPRDVVLELSERDGLPDLRRLQDVLAEYRAAGFRFALDDLGQGQTSFEMVLATRAEFFKLARPIVVAAMRDVAADAAVRALVGFAHDIGSVVIAEGIEDWAARERCAEIGVDCGQGWLFGKPQRADRLPSQ